MPKNTYQSYTDATPIDIYRKDFLHRGAMCEALSQRYPALAPIATQAFAHVTLIDARTKILQQLEDDQTRAAALENAQKFDVVAVYTELRRTMSAKNYDVLQILPENPSTLEDRGTVTFRKRVDDAIAAIAVLPDGDPIKDTFLSTLQSEHAEFISADQAEDQTQAQLKAGRLALSLFKAEEAQVREAQLGLILSILRDREQVALFTLPWRSPRKSKDEPSTPPDPSAPTG